MADRLGLTEPPAWTRTVAAQSWQIFAALRQEGFTEPQALQLLGVMLATAIANPRDGGDDG